MWFSDFSPERASYPKTGKSPVATIYPPKSPEMAQ